MNEALAPTIHIVDDESFRTALARLLRVERFDVALHAGALEFLAAAPYGPGCVLLDVDMPDCSGPELQARLGSRGDVPPIIFLTGQGDIAANVKAIKAGAEDTSSPSRSRSSTCSPPSGARSNAMRPRAPDAGALSACASAWHASRRASGRSSTASCGVNSTSRSLSNSASPNARSRRTATR